MKLFNNFPLQSKRALCLYILVEPLLIPLNKHVHGFMFIDNILHEEKHILT
jgi:hypothetical protein